MADIILGSKPEKEITLSDGWVDITDEVYDVNVNLTVNYVKYKYIPDLDIVLLKFKLTNNATSTIAAGAILKLPRINGKIYVTGNTGINTIRNDDNVASTYYSVLKSDEEPALITSGTTATTIKIIFGTMRLYEIETNAS